MKKLFLFGLISTTVLTLPAFALEETIGTNARKNLDMVIYNGNRALVKDTRSVPMKAGQNEIAFSEVSDQIIPTSVLLNGNNITFLENNFNYDVLSYESLLRKSVGETVTTEYMNPKTGLLETNQAELLAINGINPTLRINGKIDSSFPGRILFNRVPANLRTKPTLVMSVSTPTESKQDLTLNYMTTGLSWNADYVAQISEDNKSMNLDGWVSLTNNSETEFKNANLKVVAGDVHLTHARPIVRDGIYMDREGAMVMARNSVAMQEENIGDYHMYSLPRKTDIMPLQTKQVSLLNAQAVGIQKIYEFNGRFKNRSETENQKPQIFVKFMNTKENKLGIALPKGTVRLYQADKNGGMIFIGEDRINHVGNLEEVTLNMGTAFDISANSKRTATKEFKKYEDNLEKIFQEETYQVVIKNGTKAPVTVVVKEFYGKEWQILTENYPSQKENAETVKWEITVPAEGSKTLTYSVRYWYFL